MTALEILIMLGIATFATPVIGYLLGEDRDKYLGVYVALALILILGYSISRLDAAMDGGEILQLYVSPVSSTLVFDGLSLFFIIVFLIVTIISAIHSIGYMEHDSNLTLYYTLTMIMTLGLVGLSLSYDLFTFFVFWEAMAISSYVLVAFRYHLDEPVEAGMKYVIMSGVGSLILLYGISYAYGLAGSLRWDYLISTMIQLVEVGGSVTVILIVSLFLVGFGIKAAYFPFWTWLPDAHPAAPSPISALLSGIVIKAGILGVSRFLIPIASFDSNIYGPVLVSITILTLLIPNIMALLQNDIKRLLAYSSIVNIGFILIGISTFIYGRSLYGISSALTHVLSHALGKGLAFLAVGGVIYAIETRDIGRLEGFGRVHPLTGIALSIALLSLAGMPPLPGFWSKWFLILGALSVGNWILAGLGVFNSVLAVLYYLWLMQRIFLSEPSEEVLKSRPVHPCIRISLIILIGIMLLLGLYPDLMYSLAFNAGSSILP